MKKIELKDFLEYKFLSSVEFSPNGEKVAFIVHRCNYDNNNYDSNIWIMDTKTCKYSQLTSSNEERSFIWLDDTKILFSSKRDRSIQSKIESGESWSSFYYIDINGGEAKKYMDIPLGVDSIQLIDKDKFMITSEYDANGTVINDLKGDEKEKAKQKIKENKDYEVLEEIPFWHNGGTFSSKKRERIYVYDKNKDSIIPVTGPNTYVEYITCSKNKILYTANEFIGKLEQTLGIYEYDINSKKTKTILPCKKYMIQFVEYLGNNIICGMSDGKKHGLNQNSDFYLIKNGKVSLLKNHDTWMMDTVGSDCRYGGSTPYRVKNNKLYYPTTVNKSSFLNCIDSNGNEEVLTKDNGTIDSYDVYGNQIFFIGLRGQRLEELYKLNKTSEKQITSFNEDFYKNKSIVKPKKLNFKNGNLTLEGWILEPTNFDKKKKYPGILDIHGGPKTAYGEVFYHEMQAWANMGYFVFFCNPRGGDGRGDEFADLRGKYGTIDYDDIMKFTDQVIKKYPQIDKKNIGVTGGSYGGYMTNWIIGHTNRFKCAVSQRSISNWISKFGTTDIGYYFNADQNLSTPWKDHDKLWWHSPLKYADKVKTPTLFIHSEQDYRCWIGEGLQMFSALKYHGIDARLCMFKGENHELSRSGKPKHRLRRLEEMTAWFDKYLKK